MVAFRCQVRGKDGSITWRVIEAENRAEAIARIAAEGAAALDVAPRAPSLAARVAALRPGAGGARGWLAVAAPLVAAPLAATLGVTLLAGSTEREAASLARRLAARPALVTRAPVAAALGRETVSATMARLDTALPEGATLHALGRDADGVLEMEIDTADPEALRAALARDPALARLATAGETMVPDRGLRLRLVERR